MEVYWCFPNSLPVVQPTLSMPFSPVLGIEDCHYFKKRVYMLIHYPACPLLLTQFLFTTKLQTLTIFDVMECVVITFPPIRKNAM